MKTIYNKVKRSAGKVLAFNLSLFALAFATLTACTDTWDDHYAVATNGEGSMWQVISSNPSLSNFAAVLKATGYEAALSGSQVFTVFAPTNTELTDAMRDAIISQYNAEKAAGVKETKNSVIKEFVQNHISLYNYSVSSQMPDTTVTMMNGKKVEFTKTQYSGKDYLSSNILTSNGVLFTIGEVAHFLPNVYEYLAKDADLDSVWTYLSGYNLEMFQSDKSVPGEIIDGKTHYLDSVTVTRNEIIESKNWLNSRIDDEDSTYWMVAPTNEVWKALYDENVKYFQYDKKVSERDSFMYHYPRYNILAGTIFSITKNRKVFETGTAAVNDSVMSTNSVPYNNRKNEYGSYDKKFFQYTDPFGENGVFAGTENIECSNGRVLKASNWNINHDNTFLREIVMEAESNETIEEINVRTDENKAGDTQPAKYVNVVSSNPFYGKVSGNSYIELQPSGTGNFSKNIFDIRGVLSNVLYDVYVVTVPALAGDTLATSIQRLPTQFRCTLQCHNQEGFAYFVGTSKDNVLPGDMTLPVYKNNDVNQGMTTNYTNAKVAIDRLTTQADVVDSVYVGSYVFPTCSYNTAEPQVKMIIDSRVSNSANEKDYNRILRIDCIVFKPHENVVNE